MLVHESYCVPMMGTIQAFRVSLWITTSGRSDLWTTSSSLPVAEVYVPCRGCFVACAFLCVLSCARRAGGARGLLVACWGCAKKFALRGDSDREARKSSPCSAKIAGFRCFWACWASFFAVWPRWRCCWANFFAVWEGWDNAGGFMCACRAGGARGLLVAC